MSPENQNQLNQLLDISLTLHQRFLPVEAVLERVRLSKPSVYRKMNAGKFPRPVVKAGSGRVYWDARDIDDWLERRASKGGAR